MSLTIHVHVAIMICVIIVCVNQLLIGSGFLTTICYTHTQTQWAFMSLMCTTLVHWYNGIAVFFNFNQW